MMALDTKFAAVYSFRGEQSPLQGQSAGSRVAAQSAFAATHAVARHDERDAVRGHDLADGACGTGVYPARAANSP